MRDCQCDGTSVGLPAQTAVGLNLVGLSHLVGCWEG